MIPGPKNAFNLLPKYLSINSPPISSKELLYKIIIGENWHSDPTAMEIAEKWESKFFAFAKEELNKLKQTGRHYYYEFNSSSTYFFQGASFIEPNDVQEVREAKLRRSRHVNYFKQLQALTPTEFEALCIGMIKILGVINPVLTPIRSDQGLDFYGKLAMNTILKDRSPLINFTQQMEVWLVGQAKRYYSENISTLELRELVGSVVLAKQKAYASVAQIYKDLDLRTCDPIFYLFFTTSQLSADSWRLSSRAGIISLDGEMIATFLADNNIGIKDGEYDEEIFKEWLRSLK